MFLALGMLTARCVGVGSGVSSCHVTVLFIGEGGAGLSSAFNIDKRGGDDMKFILKLTEMCKCVER